MLLMTGVPGKSVVSSQNKDQTIQLKLIIAQGRISSVLAGLPAWRQDKFKESISQ